LTDKQKNLLILGVMLALLALSVYLIYPPGEKTRLGLDLQGGLEVVLEAQGDVNSEKMDQAELIIRNRVDKLGVAEPAINRQGTNQISVSLAGVTEVDEAMDLIGKTAILEFKQVDQDLTSQARQGALTPDQIPEDRQLLYQVQRDDSGEILRDEEGQPLQSPYVVHREPLMTGEALDNASVGYDQYNRPKVNMQFTSEGQSQFAQVTEKLATEGAITGTVQQMAIVLDDEIQSAPTVKEKIDSDRAEITGNIPLKEVQNTVLVLQTGALPVELVTVDKSEISATLGEDSLRQGLIAAAVGIALVMAFMVIWYRLLGVVSVLAMIFYGIFYYAVLTNPWSPATLTLPGIAGMILTVGMAADANVVIFERIKEEVRAGKTIRSAVGSGYSKGFRTILDANAVTLITAFIIFWVATAGVKGFALTLMVGVIISMITAILATRAMLSLLANLRLFNSPTLMGLKTKEDNRPWFRFDIVNRKVLWFAISGIIIVVSVLSLSTKGLNLGIDFKSGSQLTVSFNGEADVGRVRDAMSAAGYSDAVVQTIGDGRYKVTLPSLSNDEEDAVITSLDSSISVSEKSWKSVGPTFGRQVLNSMLQAIIFAWLLIIAYVSFRFEYKFAVATIVALIHDLVITVGVYSLTGREVTTATVAAVLTILGYSLYDTIIVFDRVRENQPRARRGMYADMVNQSISEVIVRSMITSVTTLMPVACLLAFGGETLKDFAFALLVGIASGAYSSIFVAAPLLTFWKEREKRYRPGKAGKPGKAGRAKGARGKAARA
jgi:SecD/SecF fusion protein